LLGQFVVNWAAILLLLFHPAINLSTNQTYLVGNQPHNYFSTKAKRFSCCRVRIDPQSTIVARLCLSLCGCGNVDAWYQGYPDLMIPTKTMDVRINLKA
jgi:hypothetical protein